MRKALCLGLLMATAACGQGGGGRDASYSVDGSDGNMTTFDASEDAAAPASTDASSRSSPRPPGIGPTAAPGVAFNYRYAFRLPGENIGRIQEEHAQACEKMGVDLCRITAMTYTDNGDRDIEARLAFKLDPARARLFGRDGIAAVTKAEGELLHAAITGTDVGSDIATANRGQAQQSDEIKRIEQQLARPGLSSGERVELQQQLQALRDSVRAGQAEQTQRRQLLATTPVVFDYRAGKTGSRLERAIADAADNFASAGITALIVLVTLLPWLVLLLLLWLAWRWLNRRFGLTGRYPERREPAEAIPPEA
ncbi:MAG TPA: DUF4349 domain-containing protein [Allosphingosinicella sp.]|nr:DUF4349 domain-containing protein [Allosphingosinicella sp.]